MSLLKIITKQLRLVVVVLVTFCCQLIFCPEWRWKSNHAGCGATLGSWKLILSTLFCNLTWQKGKIFFRFFVGLAILVFFLPLSNHSRSLQSPCSSQVQVRSSPLSCRCHLPPLGGRIEQLSCLPRRVWSCFRLKHDVINCFALKNRSPLKKIKWLMTCIEIFKGRVVELMSHNGKKNLKTKIVDAARCN